MNMCEITLYTNASSHDDAEMTLLYFVEDYCLYNGLEYGIVVPTKIIQQESAKMLMLYQQVQITRRLQVLIHEISDASMRGDITEDPLITLTSAVIPTFNHTTDMTYFVNPRNSEEPVFPIFSENNGYWYAITIIFNNPENMT